MLEDLRITLGLGELFLVRYPECLGRSIALLPAYARDAQWFDSLNESIRSRFWLILGDYGRAVAAEYLRDNHRRLKPVIRDGGTVDGVIYARRIVFRFMDGDHAIHYKSSPANWQYVGYVDVNGGRVIRVSADRDRLISRLRSAASSGVVTVCRLRLTVAEILA
jgi:hypothetical protein